MDRPGEASRLHDTPARPPRPLPGARATVGALLALSLAAAPRATAQDTTAARKLDSLAAQVEQLTRAVAVLKEQVASQAASAAGTRSRAAIEFSGRILFNAFLNSGRSNNVDVPQFAVPSVRAGQDASAGASLRQTTLALQVNGPKIWGAEASGFVETDFFGGTQSGAGGRPFLPTPRFRIARATLRWEDQELMIGQDVSLLGMVLPTGIAAIGEPTFAGAGHLWAWMPQLRFTQGLGTSGGVSWALQAALVAPWGGHWLKGDVDSTDFGERTRKPFLQARLRARWGEEESRGEIGVAGHYGWIATGADSSVVTSAVALSFQVPLTHWLEVRGEGYTGQVLAGLGDGGAGQNFANGSLFGPKPLHDTGGWVQLNAQLAAGLTLGGGCGRSNPDAADAPVILRNDLCQAHLIWRPGGLPVIALDVREIQTTLQATGLARTRQVNLAFGVEF